MTFLALLATACAGVFAGAAIYVTFVEHPARVSCGSNVAIREFGPSYRRGSVMQASLAVVGSFAGILAACKFRDLWALGGSLLLLAAVPFTLIAILPTNKELLSPELDPGSPIAKTLLERWGRLHAVRSVLGFLAFVFLLWRSATW